MAGVKFHSWSVKIYGCLFDNCMNICGCPAIVLVVPGARTTKMLVVRYVLIYKAMIT